MGFLVRCRGGRESALESTFVLRASSQTDRSDRARPSTSCGLPSSSLSNRAHAPISSIKDLLKSSPDRSRAKRDTRSRSSRSTSREHNVTKTQIGPDHLRRCFDGSSYTRSQVEGQSEEGSDSDEWDRTHLLLDHPGKDELPIVDLDTLILQL